MTDADILDHWRRAELAHAKASDHDLLEGFIAKVAAEDAAIARFGIGLHHEAYRARFPADVEEGMNRAIGTEGSANGYQ